MRVGWFAAIAVSMTGCSSLVSGAGHANPLPGPTAITYTAPTPTVRPSSPRPSATSATAIATSAAPAPTSTGPAPVSTCRPVLFGVPGSGQGLQNPPPKAVPSGVSRTDAQAYGTAVGLVKTTLVQLAGSRLAATHAISYPATALPHWFGADGRPTGLNASEAAGTQALVSAIRGAELGRCLGRPVLLAGYSQGAEVVIRAVNALAREQRAGVTVVLFGNPSYQPGVAGDYPGTVRAHGLRPSVTGVAYMLSANVRRQTLDICAPRDPVCGMSPAAQTESAQLAYLTQYSYVHASAYAFGTAGYAKLGAQFLWQHR